MEYDLRVSPTKYLGNPAAKGVIVNQAGNSEREEFVCIENRGSVKELITSRTVQKNQCCINLFQSHIWALIMCVA